MLDGLEGWRETVGGVAQDVKTFVSEKPLQTAAVGVAVVGLGTLGAKAISGTGLGAAL